MRGDQPTIRLLALEPSGDVLPGHGVCQLDADTRVPPVATGATRPSSLRRSSPPGCNTGALRWTVSAVPAGPAWAADLLHAMPAWRAATPFPALSAAAKSGRGSTTGVASRPRILPGVDIAGPVNELMSQFLAQLARRQSRANSLQSDEDRRAHSGEAVRPATRNHSSACTISPQPWGWYGINAQMSSEEVLQRIRDAARAPGTSLELRRGPVPNHP